MVPRVGSAVMPREGKRNKDFFLVKKRKKKGRRVGMDMRAYICGTCGMLSRTTSYFPQHIPPPSCCLVA